MHIDGTYQHRLQQAPRIFSLYIFDFSFAKRLRLKTTQNIAISIAGIGLYMEHILDITTTEGLFEIHKFRHQIGGADAISLSAINSTLAKNGASGAQTFEVGNKACFLKTLCKTLVGLFGKHQSDISYPTNIQPNKQLVLARTLIELGKESGVKKLTIKVSKEVGAVLRGTYLGASIKGKVGVDRKFYIDVEYN